MFDVYQKFTGTGYTATLALLAIALVFIPAICLFLRPGYLGLSLAFACGTICVILARVSWKRSSRLTIPSIATQYTGAK
jgi:hypothetical protein